MANATTKLWVLAVSVVLLVQVWIMPPAWADKPVQAVKFDPSSSVVNVAQIFETTAADQKTVISSLLKSSKSFFKKTPGFGSFTVLQSQDGSRVLTLSQWEDPASYEAFLTQPADDSKSSKDKGEKAGPVEPTRTLMLQVENTLAAEGAVAAIRGKDALVQINEITAKSSEDLDQLVASTESLLPSVKQIFPSPRSAALLKQVDGADLLLLTNWGSAAEYEDLSLVPAFAPLAEETMALAENDQHLYTVVKTISPKPDKSGKGKAEKD
jgi:heme-degrading monooxygenase HmoA